MAVKKPKVRKAGHRTKSIFIRVTEAQKQVIAGAAKESGISLSSWVLSVVMRAAQKMKTT